MRPQGNEPSADRTSEGHDLDSARASLPERRSRSGGGGSTRIDVVDQADGARRGPSRSERAGNVASSLLQAEPALGVDRASSAHVGVDWESPRTAELTCQRLGRAVSSLERTVAIGGHERERRHSRPGECIHDDRGGYTRELPLPTFLPGRDEATRGVVVDDGRAGRGEGKPPPTALGTPSDRPRSRRATPRAERRRKPDQTRATALAERLP